MALLETVMVDVLGLLLNVKYIWQTIQQFNEFIYFWTIIGLYAQIIS
jgi:hypothetical protein